MGVYQSAVEMASNSTYSGGIILYHITAKPGEAQQRQCLDIRGRIHGVVTRNPQSRTMNGLYDCPLQFYRA